MSTGELGKLLRAEFVEALAGQNDRLELLASVPDHVIACAFARALNPKVTTKIAKRLGWEALDLNDWIKRVKELRPSERGESQ